MKDKRAKKWKSRGVNLMISGITCLLLFVIYLLIFNSYQKNIKRYDHLKHDSAENDDLGPLKVENWIQLGVSQYTEKCPQTSYLHYPFKKDTGKFRIGIFGCSIVNGFEAPHGFDFPSALQRLYTLAGDEEVEVLNFGVGAYGMGRTFYLWNQLAALYDLDLTIFNLMEFHRRRDNTFIFDENTFGPVYSRYIIENGKLRHLEVKGESRFEVSQGYHQAIPSLHYLLHDIKTPPPFKALMPKGKRLKRNPFYFHPQPEAEWRELYPAIFDSVARKSKELLVMCNNEEICSISDSVKSPNVHFYQTVSNIFQANYAYWYRAPGAHPSALGYQQYATELFAYLHDDPDYEFSVLRAKRKSMDSISFDPDLGNMEEIQNIYWTLSGKKIGVLGKKTQKNNWVLDELTFMNEKMKAILDVSSPDKLHFLSLSHPLKGGEVMYLQANIDGETATTQMGQVDALSAIWGTLPLVGFQTELEGIHFEWVSTSNKVISLVHDNAKAVSDVKIFLGEQLIMEGGEYKQKQHQGPHLLLIPKGGWIAACAPVTQDFWTEEIPRSGDLYLNFVYRDGKKRKFPYLEYQMVNLPPDSIKYVR